VGRLFWKFFAFVWVAQLVGIVATGSTFWLTQRHAERTFDLTWGPDAETRVQAAGAILTYAGISAFKDWAQHEIREPVYAIDSSGSDVLQRAVPASLLRHARQLHEEDPRSPLVTAVLEAHGGRFLVFAAALEPGFGADPMPRSGRFREPLGPPGPDAPRGRHGGDFHGLPSLPMLATLVASLVTAVLLAWYVAKPIRSLRAAFDGVAAGNLGLRVMPQIGGRQDELADLGSGFDRMAERLQSAMERQRRLLHDVSHQVRSPLARLQAAVGLLRRKSDGDDPAIDRIEEEIARIDLLVRDLLNLSRLEAGELAGAVEEVDLDDLIAEIVADANFEAERTGRSILWRNGASATLRGRPDMLRVAIENVVRNALKHAPESRDITIDSSIHPDRASYTIRVLDTGPGVPEEDLEKMFTPFFRSAQAARVEGYGLGLAIARRSVEANGGSIRAENGPAGGLAVVIELPLPPAAVNPPPAGPA